MIQKIKKNPCELDVKVHQKFWVWPLDRAMFELFKAIAINLKENTSNMIYFFETGGRWRDSERFTT